jgi:hypothetical protein
MFVEHERDVCFECQAGAFQDDFGSEFGYLSITKANKSEILSNLFYGIVRRI